MEQGHTPAPALRPPSILKQLHVWLLIGVQSFGGGAATIYLIRRAAVEQHGWLSEDEFTRYWGICQIAPGVNIIGLTVLIGHNVRGALGVVLALMGLLLPSVAITIVITGLYASIQGLDIVQAALRGVVSATIGISILLAISIGRPALEASRQETNASLVLSVALILISAALVGLWHAPVVAVLFGAGIVGAVAHWAGIGGGRTS